MHVQIIEERKICLAIRYKTFNTPRARRRRRFGLNLTLYHHRIDGSNSVAGYDRPELKTLAPGPKRRQGYRGDREEYGDSPDQMATVGLGPGMI
jgi:hypothetical protein